MRSWLAVAAIIVLVAAPAQAQMGGGGGRHGGGDKDKGTEQKKPQVDEKAYKAALDRIPEPKEKYDPWGAARPAQPASSDKTKAK